MRIHKLHLRKLLALSVLVFLGMITDVNAGHNWNIVQIHQESLKASISVYRAFSSVYQSFVFLEEGKLKQANSIWKKKVISDIKKARSIYKESASKLSNQPIYLIQGIPQGFQPMILMDLGKYGLSFPVSLRDLASVAEIELKKLEDSFAKVQFGADKAENRKLLRTINYGITRFISLGISFSTISMLSLIHI